jgi:hypothetical protein
MSIDRLALQNGWRGACVPLIRALCMRRRIGWPWVTLGPLRRTIVCQIGYFEDQSTKAARPACGSDIIQDVRI